MSYTSIGIVCLLVLSFNVFAHPHDEEHPGHSSQGPAFNEGPRQMAKLYQGMGKVDFPITTKSKESQKFFNQGVAQLHGFFSFEAERSFRTAAFKDPDCAMCYWGMAMANTVDLAGSQPRAKDFIQMAKQKMNASTPREQLWILSLWNLYQAGVPMQLPARENYIKELEQIHVQFPTDIEAKAFTILTRWENLAMFKGTYDPSKLDKEIDEILLAFPKHPAHHYKIHLWDSQGKPEPAIKSAAQCGPVAPELAHMWHMPGHIYWRMQRYFDSAWQQEASARVDHKNMAETGNLPYQIGNYLHNNTWVMQSWDKIGNTKKPLGMAKSLIEVPRHPKENTASSYAADALKYLFVVLDNYEMWDETLQLADMAYFDTEGVAEVEVYKSRLLVLAKGAKHLPNNLILDQISLARAQLPLARLEIEKLQSTQPEVVGYELKKLEAVEAELALVEISLNEPLKLKEAVKEWEKKVVSAAPPTYLSYFSLNPDYHLDQWYLKIEEGKEAIRVAEANYKNNMQSVQAISRLVETYFKNGDKQKAKALFETELRPRSEAVTLENPLMKRLTQIAVEFGYLRDWRIPRVVPGDIGYRPPLETMGPLYWSSVQAPKGVDPVFDGYLNQKKPLLVVHYIGGCPLCSAQIKALTEEGWDLKFKEAGIQLLGVGTKIVTETASFPLLSDPEIKLHKAFLAHDDFESKPLHGIFLIDAKGRILWKTVTADTFTDFQFLLNESQRLLKLK